MLTNPGRHEGTMCYILDLTLQQEQKEWKPCRVPAGHNAFRRPRGDEWRQIQKLEEEPASPHVVSWVQPAANAA